MDTRHSFFTTREPSRRAFTLIELLTVIAIIAILAAILFPVFGTVREQTRQSNTLSSMHNIYVAVRQFHDDEGRYPPVLFGYAETIDDTTKKPRYAKDDDLPTPMNESVKAYLYREHAKDYTAFTCADNLVTDKTEITHVYPPLSLVKLYPSRYQANTPLTWQDIQNPTDPCPVYGDPDLPVGYAGKEKLFYAMDSMDIGPQLDEYGVAVKDPTDNTKIKYELHYSPDWTHYLGSTCDVNSSGDPVVSQLKYRNPPQERTVITYITDHVATAKSNSVLVLLLSGTARKVNYKQANNDSNTPQLPLDYRP